MGSATTFTGLIGNPNSEKIFLAEIKVSELVQAWTKTGGLNYTYEKSYLADTITLANGDTETITKTVIAVKQNTISYEQKASTAEVDATASSFWHDTANGLLYIHTSDDSAPGSFTIIVYFWLYFATKPIYLGTSANQYYEPYLNENSIPRLSQQVQSLRYGIVTVSSGRIGFSNANGYFDQLSRLYVWINGELKLLLGGDNLPYSEYTSLFIGKIQNPRITNLEYQVDLKSLSFDLLRSIPINDFWTSTYPNLDPIAQGMPIPLYYGVYDESQAPLATCIDSAYGVNTYQFKICDTTYWPIQDIDQVYIDYLDGAGWQTIAHSNESLANATFTISSASFVLGTTRVKVAFSGYHNGGVRFDGAPEIAEDLLITWCGLSASDLDSTSFTTSKALSTCVLNVTIEKVTSALTIVEQICSSDLAYFSETALGKLRYITWSPVPGGSAIADLTKDDIWDVRFEDDVRSLYYKARIGYSFQCVEQKYIYESAVSNESQYKYQRNESLTMQTYLRNQDDAISLAYRLNLLTKELLTTVTFSMSVGQISALIGESITLTLSRSPDAAAGGQDAKPYEIVGKEFSAYPASVKFTGRDMATFGLNVGFWTPSSYVDWASASDAERASAGYWTDANGFADSTAAESQNVSLWW